MLRVTYRGRIIPNTGYTARVTSHPGNIAIVIKLSSKYVNFKVFL
jgi:hypothetical protein